MPKAILVKRGNEYLSDVQLSALEEMHRRERPGKSRDRLQAAVLRKQGRTLEEIGRIVGRWACTVHRWLSRMEREGPEGRHDGKSPGRPRLLNAEQEKTIEGDLDGTPRDSGFGRQQLERQDARQAHTRQVRRTVQPEVCHQAGAPSGVLGQKAAAHPVQQRHTGGTDGVH